jgi:hypothetical protein
MCRAAVTANLLASEQPIACVLVDAVLPTFSDGCFRHGVCEYMTLPSASVHLYMSARAFTANSRAVNKSSNLVRPREAITAQYIALEHLGFLAKVCRKHDGV